MLAAAQAGAQSLAVEAHICHDRTEIAALLWRGEQERPAPIANSPCAGSRE